MGNLAGLRSGPYRGTRLIRPKVVLHRHRDAGLPAIDITPYVTSISCHKALAEPAGSFSLGLRSRCVGRRSVDWLDEVDDDDWIAIEVWAWGTTWVLWLGMIDRVSEQGQGAGGAKVVTVQIDGRDAAKPLVDTELLDLPFAPWDPLLARATLYGVADALASTSAGITPGGCVGALVDYILRRGQYRQPGAELWTLPGNLKLRGATTAGDFGDVLLTAIDAELEGLISAESITAEGGAPKLFDLLRSYANEPLNELFVDLRPHAGLAGAAALAANASGLSFAAATGAGVAAMAYSVGAGVAAYGVGPCLVLREKPFPANLATTPTRPPPRLPTQHWLDLPTTTLDASDLESFSLSRGGDERFNYVLLESGSSAWVSKHALAMASTRGGTADGAWDGIPSIDTASVKIHGWKRIEQSSNYVAVTGANGDFDLYAGWTHLLRDWYGLGHRYLSGSVSSAMLLPNVRIGERLTLTRDGAPPLHAYIEAVTHQIDVTDEAEFLGRTTLQLTRGVRGGLVQLPDVSKAVIDGGSDLIGRIA